MVNIISEEGGFFPPPWNSYEHPEKTEGWIEFQREMRKDPKYYSFQPERTSPEDHIVEANKMVCDVPNCGNT